MEVGAGLDGAERRHRECFSVSKQGIVLVTREAPGSAIPVRESRRVPNSTLTEVA